MNEYPIIVKIESQKCIRETARPDGTLVSTIENVGVDNRARRWRFLSDTTYVDIGAPGRAGRPYAFVQLSAPR